MILAKHKKRKSPPQTRDKPANVEKKDEAPPTDTPQRDIEPVAPNEVSPPPIDIQNFNVEDKNRKLDQLYWMRILLAIVAGVTAVFIFEPIQGEERRWASIGFMIILFLGTIFVAKAMNIPLPKSDRKKIVTQAIASYVFLYLFVWVLTHTIVFAFDRSSGVSPF